MPIQTERGTVSFVLRLLDLAYETGDATVRTGATIIAEDPLERDAHVLTMTRLLVEQKQSMTERLQKMVERCVSPPILVQGEMPDIELSDGQIVVAGDWPKAERAVIEASRVVYFRDFLRSLWRRLT